MIPYIPKQFFDTHIHTGFLKADKNTDISPWKSDIMLSGYFFETGLNITSLDTLYPFSEKTLYGVAFPIPYGPFHPLDVNKEIIQNSVGVPRLLLALRGDVSPEEIATLETQIQSSPQIIGLKLYQTYDKPHTTEFLKQALYQEFLEMAKRKSLTFFIHTNHLTLDSLDFLESILQKYQNIKIILTHAGVELGAYSSFSFENEEEYKYFEVSQEHIQREEKYISDYRKKAERIAKIPRLYVNPALLANEITLYAIVEILAPAKKIIWGSDLPFSYTHRIRQYKTPYSQTAPLISELFQGEYTEPCKELHENLLFLLERMWKVLCFAHPHNAKELFHAMLWDIPAQLFLKR